MQLYKFKIILLYIFLINSLLSSALVAQSMDHNGANVFMYHRFDEPKYPSTNINTEVLKQHLEYLLQNEFNIVSINEILNKKNLKDPFLTKTTAFTVDDAFLSFFENGWPIFKRYNIPVTLFVSTDVVEENHWNYMSWDQLRQFIKEGGSVGLHSASHGHLPQYDINDIETDLIKSMKLIEKELGLNPKVFAYPYGEASNEIIGLLQKLNINYAFGQHSGIIHHKTNSYYMPRFALNENYGKLDRFIFSANAKPLIINNFYPSEIFLRKNKQPKIQFDVLSDIGENQINCYDNSGGSWKDTKVTADNEMRITLELNDPFLSGRGRVNCTAKNNSEWLWFGYQFTVE